MLGFILNAYCVLRCVGTPSSKVVNNGSHFSFDSFFKQSAPIFLNLPSGDSFKNCVGQKRSISTDRFMSFHFNCSHNVLFQFRSQAQELSYKPAGNFGIFSLSPILYLLICILFSFYFVFRFLYRSRF